MKKELLTSAVVIVFCLALISQALKLPAARFETLGPSFFPLLVLSGIVALSLLHVALTLMLRGKPLLQRSNTFNTTDEPVTAEEQRRTVLLTVCTVAAFIAYGMVLELTELPYAPLTVLFITATTWILSGFRRAALLSGLAVAVLVTGFIHIVFGVYLHTIFP